MKQETANILITNTTIINQYKTLFGIWRNFTLFNQTGLNQTSIVGGVQNPEPYLYWRVNPTTTSIVCPPNFLTTYHISAYFFRVIGGKQIIESYINSFIDISKIKIINVTVICLLVCWRQVCNCTCRSSACHPWQPWTLQHHTVQKDTHVATDWSCHFHQPKQIIKLLQHLFTLREPITSNSLYFSGKIRYTLLLK